MDLLHTPAVRQSVAPPEGWGCGRQWHTCKEAWLGGLGTPMEGRGAMDWPAASGEEKKWGRIYTDS